VFFEFIRVVFVKMILRLIFLHFLCDVGGIVGGFGIIYVSRRHYQKQNVVDENFNSRFL